ncbi:MAG: DegT/DnrJ/EryC1/StrS family aminotransferase [Polyangiales bacterium]
MSARSETPARVEFYRHQLGAEEKASWATVLETLFLTLGPQVASFERELGEYLVAGSDRAPLHVVGTNSCSMGLLVAHKAFDIGPGDEVITTPMTFAASLNAALHLGAKIVLVDVEPTTGLLDPAKVRAAITPKTKAIVPVHLYGQLADMRALRAIADEHQLVIIEDSAHGIEMERDGVRAGQLGDAAVFSFYATKNLTSGDGGAIATRHAHIADRCRRLRNHGASKSASDRHGGGFKHWDLVELGYKANLTDLDAALLRPQLPRADEKRGRREQLAHRYESEFRKRLASHFWTASKNGVPFLVESRGKSAHHLFTIQPPARLRDPLLTRLGEAGIGVAVNYLAAHTLSYLVEVLKKPRGSFPIAEEIGDRTISLPMYPTLTEAEQDRVVDVVATSLIELSK